MKYINLIFLVCLVLFTECGREDVSKGGVIVDTFYIKTEQENYKGVDSLMSFRFYQITPYKNFIKILSEKNKKFGKIQKKPLEKYKIIKSAIDTIHLGYNVTYKNTNTKESFTLIKEDNDYKIYKYYIHREK